MSDVKVDSDFITQENNKRVKEMVKQNLEFHRDYETIFQNIDQMTVEEIESRLNDSSKLVLPRFLLKASMFYKMKDCPSVMEVPEDKMGDIKYNNQNFLNLSRI